MNIKSLLTSPCHWLLCAPLSLEITPEKRHLLSREEQARARRFRQPLDQKRHQLAHILKRYCLANIMKVGVQGLSFYFGKKNKPYCKHPGAPYFNLSHSGDWVLLGVSTITEIGVDVEADRDVSDGVVSFILNTQQQLELSQDTDPFARFMIYWTQKEAVAKALGLGLSMNVQSIDCSGQFGHSRLLHSKGQFHLYSQRLDNKHTMSVASMSADPVHLYQLTDWSTDDWQLQALNT